MHLSSLHLYPIKSARGIAVEQAHLDDFGLVLDRRWMVVDAAGDLITQREAHQMALVDVALENGHVVASTAGREPLRLPQTPGHGPEIRVRVWDDTCNAIDMGPDAAAWFTDYLERPARLVYMPDTTFRRVNPAYVAEPRRVSFADAYPVLLIGQNSLADLNRRLPAPLPMNRFRPNIVVEGGEPFEEDRWRHIQIGNVRFEVVKPCDRCVTTTIDQDTGEQGKEPLTTLSRFRKWNGQVFFGQNAVHQSAGTLHLGDPVTMAGDP